MRKLFALTAILFTCNFAFGQSHINLRKVILKSDLIISTDDYRRETIWVNDFTFKTLLQMDRIDSTNVRFLHNKLSTTPKKLTLRAYDDGEDYFSDLITNGGGCVRSAIAANIDYDQLFFIKKDKNEYQVLMHLDGLKWEQREAYRKQIATLQSIERIKSEKERFAATLDWFIENGLMPDDDFTTYYKQKGITTDTIQYSAKQYHSALRNFQEGKEDLLPMLRKQYPEEIKLYYIQKMENELNREEPDYYKFWKAFQDLTGDQLSNDETDYILNYSLTEEKFNKYDKKRIMEHLINVAKER